MTGTTGKWFHKPWVLAVGVWLALAGSASAQTPAAPAAGDAAKPAPAETEKPAAEPAAEKPAAAAAPTAAAEAPSSAGADAAYNVRLKSLQRNVDELKEQVFRTKARLNLLKEAVLGGVIGASRAMIRHKNEMGSSYRLVKAIYALDGVQIFGRSDDTGRLAEMTEFDIYNGAIQPGSHTLSVVLQYQGHGFGVFSYLKGYKFNVKASHTFVAGEDKATNITVVGFEKGNITTNLQDRPAIDFRVNVLTAGESSSKK